MYKIYFTKCIIDLWDVLVLFILIYVQIRVFAWFLDINDGLTERDLHLVFIRFVIIVPFLQYNKKLIISEELFGENNILLYIFHKMKYKK